MARQVNQKTASLSELSPAQMKGAQFKTRTVVETYIETADGTVIPLSAKSGEVATKANLEQFSAVTNANELMAASDVLEQNMVDARQIYAGVFTDSVCKLGNALANPPEEVKVDADGKKKEFVLSRSMSIKSQVD